jgi:hypothetical protein
MLLYAMQYDATRYWYRVRKDEVVNRNEKKGKCVDEVRREGGDEVGRLIDEVERLDVELYGFGKELFWSRVRSLPPGVIKGEFSNG